MKNNTINKIVKKLSDICAVFLYIQGLVIFIWCLVFLVWNKCVSDYIDKQGSLAVVTVIDINRRNVTYDMEYDGDYYVIHSTMTLRESRLYKLSVGERYYAKIWKDKLKYHRLFFAPSYIRMTFCPLPINEQDYIGEQSRIDSMYHYRHRY